MLVTNMRTELFEFTFGAEGGEVRDLRFERTGELGGGVDDATAEVECAASRPFDAVGKLVEVGIEPDAEEAIIRQGGGLEPLAKSRRPGCW